MPTLAALRNILGNAEAGIPDYVVEKARRCAAAHEQSVRMFRDAGGRIALGTDAGTPFNLHGHNAGGTSVHGGSRFDQSRGVAGRHFQCGGSHGSG